MIQRAPSRPLTQNNARQVTKPIIDGLGEIIFGSPNIFQRDEFTAAPPTGNPLTDTVRALTQYNCRRWARADKTQFSDSVNTANANICGLYLDSLGENPGNGAVGPPFTGGQCDGEIYAGVVEWESGPESAPSIARRAFVCRGPLIGAFAQGGPSSPVGIGVTARGAGLTGQVEAACPVFPPATGQPVEYRPFVNGARLPRIVSVIACGQDNCGNPPPTVRPPGRITGGTPPPPSITINLPGFGNTPVTIGPNPDGDIEVCFPELQICVTVSEPSEGEGGASEPAPPNGPNDNGPGDPSAIGEPGGEGEDGDFGDPPKGRAWIGAFVRFSVPPALGNIPSANPANEAYATVIGNVCLDHGGRFSDAKQVRSEWVSAIRENPNLTVRGCRVNVRPGVSFRVYPVSVETCPESLCPIEAE